MASKLDRIGLAITKQTYSFSSLVPVARHPGIILHWMGEGRFTEDSRNPGAVVQGIHKAAGYAGIGYHGIATQSGAYYTGRPYKHRGAHCADGRAGIDKNDHFGLLWYGGNGNAAKGIAADEPTPAALETLAKAIAWVCLDQGIPCSRAYIKGHREHLSTACPGTLHKHLDGILARARQILASLDQPEPEKPAVFKVILNGQEAAGALIVNDRGFVALADLPKLGCKVHYDPKTKTATVTTP